MPKDKTVYVEGKYGLVEIPNKNVTPMSLLISASKIGKKQTLKDKISRDLSFLGARLIDDTLQSQADEETDKSLVGKSTESLSVYADAAQWGASLPQPGDEKYPLLLSAMVDARVNNPKAYENFINSADIERQLSVQTLIDVKNHTPAVVRSGESARSTAKKTGEKLDNLLPKSLGGLLKRAKNMRWERQDIKMLEKAQREDL